tara:strand:- start:21 stop:407 length:387 start_codon:yes stop_codon:yes gene_type:complete
MKINDFLIINCIGENDRLGLRINKDFFIHNLYKKKNYKTNLVYEIHSFLNIHKADLSEKFSVIVNQGPGSFSGIRASLAIAKGLEISKKTKLYGYKSTDLSIFDQESIEYLLSGNLVEKNLIKPIYLS